MELLLNYTLQQLRYLVAVADHGSVSAAARSLYVSQPGLSSAILHLEEIFGIQCFIRHRAKGVSLTPAGRLFVKEVRDVLYQASNLQQRAKELNQTIVGRLDVGCSSTIGPLLVPRILGKFHEDYPEIEVKLQDGDGYSLQAAVKEGRLELALLYDINIDPTFEKLALASFPPYVLLPKRHRLSRETSINLADLVDEPLLLFGSPEHPGFILSLFSSLNKMPTISQQVTNFELVRGLVAAGKGYSVLYTRPALNQSYDGSPVACIPISGKVPFANVVLASTGNKSHTSRAEAFITTCRSMLGSFDSPVFTKDEIPRKLASAALLEPTSNEVIGWA